MYKEWGSIATNLRAADWALRCGAKLVRVGWRRKRGTVRVERWSWHVSIDRCQFGEANHGFSETTALWLAGR